MDPLTRKGVCFLKFAEFIVCCSSLAHRTSCCHMLGYVGDNLISFHFFLARLSKIILRDVSFIL